MTIERITAPSPAVFHKEYVAQDRPVILTDMVDSWPARKSWSPAYWQDKFGKVRIRVKVLEQDRPTDPDYYLHNKISDDSMTIAEYIEKTEHSEPSGRLYMSQVPITKLIPEVQNDLRAFPYQIAFPRRVGNGRGMLWMGPQGCSSALHFDPYHNFYVQLWGKKRWVVFPKSQQHMLYVPSQLPLRYFSPIDFLAPDLAQYPKYADASPLELTLEPGETLFLPEGWVHYVETVHYSIALNFFWCTWGRTLKNLPRDVALVNSHYVQYMLGHLGRAMARGLRLTPRLKA